MLIPFTLFECLSKSTSFLLQKTQVDAKGFTIWRIYPLLYIIISIIDKVYHVNELETRFDFLFVFSSFLSRWVGLTGQLRWYLLVREMAWLKGFRSIKFITWMPECRFVIHDSQMSKIGRRWGLCLFPFAYAWCSLLKNNYLIHLSVVVTQNKIRAVL